MGIIIHGTGCCLIDYLYTNVRFGTDSFQQYFSRRVGDGGLSPGKLVFTDDLERFGNRAFGEILGDLVGRRTPDAVNLGGPASVALIHAAQILEDATVRYHGGRGTDETGDLIEGILARTPVDATSLEVVPGETAFTYVFSDPTYNDGRGERMFVNNIGAAWNYGPDRLRDQFFEADIILFGGTALVPPIHRGLTGLLRRGRERGCINVVTTVYDFLSEQNDSQAPWPLGEGDASFPLIDLLIVDREEALRTSGQSNIEAAAAELAEKGVGALIITQGGDPVRLFSRGRLFRETPLASIPVARAIDEKLRRNPERRGDTTGCGDNLVGGVLTSLARQLSDRKPGALDLVRAASLGVVSGGFACFYAGGTYHEGERGAKRLALQPYLDAYGEQVGLEDL